MAYLIELMSIGEDQYKLLEAAANSLNAVQGEFQFRVTSVSQRGPGISFGRSSYYTPDIWEFLKKHKNDFRGNRPFLIAFVNAPLASPKLKNLFGSHRAEVGMAVVTLYQSTQYVSEAKRYCCYYLVRYAMSFVNPLLQSHAVDEIKNCYFHKKIYKPEIRLSMDSAHVCDDCMTSLQRPADPNISKPLSVEEHEALKNMLTVVSGDYAHALIMKGGGVKGLAFAGALKELETYFWFDVHVGASAGAITAVLLAANYSPTELIQLLMNKSFRQFMDASIFRIPFNLLLRQGIFPGEHFMAWMSDLLRKKIQGIGDIRMRDLPRAMNNSGKDAVIYACRAGAGTVVFDSRGERKDEEAAFAVRCSMSIPVFFVAPQMGGRRVYDGGLRNNFPLKRFLEDNDKKPFIALYLGKADNSRTRWLWSELADIWISGEELAAVDSHADSVIVIDTTPIGTVDFKLTDQEKQFLLQVGRAAALRFLGSRNLDDGPDAETIKAACDDADASRKAVVRMRRRRLVRRRLVLVLILSVAAGLAFWRWHGLSSSVEGSSNRSDNSNMANSKPSSTPDTSNAATVKPFSFVFTLVAPDKRSKVEFGVDRIVNDDRTPSYLLKYLLMEKAGGDFRERIRFQVNVGNDPRVQRLLNGGSKNQGALLMGPITERAKALPAGTKYDEELSSLIVSLLDTK
ncbi:MAG: patatin-like phospholipase family protein [Acidobacteriota bacterium]